MGNDVSSIPVVEESDVWNRLRIDLSSWRLNDVLVARGRYISCFEENFSPLVPRKVFWNIFSDYSEDSFKAHDNKFLCLPLYVFSLFENKPLEMVDAREVFCLLALSSQGGQLAGKLRLLFPLFGPVINQERIAQILGCILRPLFRVGALKKYPSMKALIKFASYICRSGGFRVCKTVSSQFLADFFLTNEKLSDILSLFISSKEISKGKLNTLTVSSEDIAKKQSKMKNAVKSLLQAANATPKKKSTRKKDNSRKLGNKNDFVLEQQSRKLRQAELKKERENKKMRRAKRIALAEVMKLNASEFTKIRGKFLKNGNSEKGVSSDRFSELMSSYIEALKDRFLSAQLFKSFDTNSDGFITFEEFLIAVAKNKGGTLKEKINFIFLCYAGGHAPNKASAVEHEGIDIDLLVRLIQNSNSEVMECAYLVELIVTMMDVNGDGEVDADEFTSACKNVPNILDCFDQCLSPSGRLRNIVKALVDCCPNFGFDSLFQAWEHLGSRRQEFITLPLGKFYTLMSSILQTPCEGKVFTLLQQLFKKADKSIENRSEAVDGRRLLLSLLKLLPPEDIEEEKMAMFYFNLFDLDASESVEYSEFFEMLYAAQLGVQDSSWKAIDALRQADDDENGFISESEFLAVIQHDSNLFECFAKMLCATEEELDEDKVVAEEPNEDNADTSTNSKEYTLPPKKLDIENDNVRIDEEGIIFIKVPSGEEKVRIPVDIVYKTTYEHGK